MAPVCFTVVAVKETVHASWPPRWILWLAAVLIITCTVMMFVGAWAVGSTWDEHSQTVFLQTYFNSGWFVAPGAVVHGVADPHYMFGIYVYGPVADLIAHGFTALIGLEPWKSQSTSAAAYGARHTAIAGIALAGVAASAVTVKVITRSWRWALLAAAVLAVTPLWLGHGMFNNKDIPCATGYTIATLGIVALCRLDYFAHRAVRITCLVALVAGAVLASGTRPVLGLPNSFSGVVCMVYLAVVRTRVADPSAMIRWRLWRRSAEGLGALVVAYLALIAIYPKAYLNPIQLGVNAIIESGQFPMNEAQLTAGTWMVQPVSPTYLPLWFAAQLPLLVSIAAILGVCGWLWISTRGLLRGFGTVQSAESSAMQLAVVLQLLLLPMAAIAGHSVMYNAERQMLFVVSAAAILATICLYEVANRLQHRPSGSSRRWSMLLWATVVLGLLGPVIGQIRLFPYNYVYFNIAATAWPIDGNWSTDYWRASGPELLAHTPRGGPDSCGYDLLQHGGFPPCTTQSMFSPYLSLRGTATTPHTLLPTQYWFIRENNGDLVLPRGCTPYDTITRHLFFRTITIGQIAICDKRLAVPVRNVVDPSKPLPPG